MRRNPDFIKHIRAEAMARTDRATTHMRDVARARMDRSGVSEPGESPVSQSGELSESLQSYPAVDRDEYVVGAMGTDLFRIIWLERGTANMQPRPLLLPSLLASREGVMQIMTSGGEDG